MTDGGRGSAVILRGGQVIDGSGGAPRRADVAIDGGRITGVGAQIAIPGARAIDARGLAIAPGFIDLHTHCDFSLQRYPRAASMVCQGVTTVVVGNCGHSTFPVGQGERRDLLLSYSSFLGSDLDWSWSDASGFARMLSALRLAVNVALLVGHGTARVAAMGFDARPPAGSELAQMQAAVADAMEAGAFGISSGLIYPPGSYATTDEVVALAQVAARYGGFYSTHMRNEGPDLLAAVGEAVEVAERAAIPLQISHHKVLGRRNWGLTAASLRLIDQARLRGVDVTADQYPYPASSTTLAALLPAWAVEGGTERMRTRLLDPGERAQIRAQILDGGAKGAPKRDFEPETVLIASLADGSRELVGRSLSEIASARTAQPVDVMLDLLTDYGGGVQAVIFAIGDDDIRRVMSHPEVAVASDGWTLHPDAGGCPHPRSYGTFARVLGRYVRDQNVLTLPEAVRKMTSLPARRLGLSDRGILRPGAVADLVVFDPATVTDRATFTAPHQFCAGVMHVFVNGVQVIDQAADTGLDAGQVLRGRGAR